MQVVPFYQHAVGQAELDEIADVFLDHSLATDESASQFERMFADSLGRHYVRGVTSRRGTLHVALEGRLCDLLPMDLLHGEYNGLTNIASSQ